MNELSASQQLGGLGGVDSEDERDERDEWDQKEFGSFVLKICSFELICLRPSQLYVCVCVCVPERPHVLTSTEINESNWQLCRFETKTVILKKVWMLSKFHLNGKRQKIDWGTMS